MEKVKRAAKVGDKGVFLKSGARGGNLAPGGDRLFLEPEEEVLQEGDNSLPLSGFFSPLGDRLRDEKPWRGRGKGCTVCPIIKASFLLYP